MGGRETTRRTMSERTVHLSLPRKLQNQGKEF